MEKESERITKDELGEFLYFMRLSVNMTRDDFSKRIGCSGSQYRKWERGVSVPRDTFLLIENVRNTVKLIQSEMRVGA